MKNSKEVLVVGSGLSGLCVAYQFFRKGCAVTIIDNGVNHSSSVAAGMINPLVFRRMTKSWRLDEFMEYLLPFYTELETLTQSTFYNQLEIRRLFSSEQERGFWMEKQSLPEFYPYMHLITAEDSSYNKTKNTYGSGRVKQSAFIDTAVFLSSFKSYLSNEIVVLQEIADYHSFKNGEYKNTSYDHIVFCEGYLGLNNPFFNYLPLT